MQLKTKKEQILLVIKDITTESITHSNISHQLWMADPNEV